jgi:hypothetical protein
LKKTGTAQEPKMAISKKRKLSIVPSFELKVGEEAPSTPSAAEVAEILKVMTDSPPFKLLSPLGSELTKIFTEERTTFGCRGESKRTKETTNSKCDASH